MSSKKHLVFIDREKWERDIFQKHFLRYHLTFLNNLGAFDKIRDAEVLSVFINTKVTENVLTKLPKLKFITTRSTGFDHIDAYACRKRGIKVANVPTYGENTVAEHTFGLILSLSRKIHQAVQRTKLSDFSIKGLRGFDLKGRTIGVIGAGHIGQHVIRIAHGFEMKVLVSDPCVNQKLAKEMNFKLVGLKELLKNSDIVTLHCPLCPSTYQLINTKNIILMKKGGILINTARGELIDNRSIVNGLKKGILAGVGLDVLEEEQLIHHEDNLLDSGFNMQAIRNIIEGHVLLKHPDVIVTPHIAFNSREAIERIVNTTVFNIQSYLNSRPANLVKV